LCILHVFYLWPVCLFVFLGFFVFGVSLVVSTSRLPEKPSPKWPTAVFLNLFGVFGEAEPFAAILTAH